MLFRIIECYLREGASPHWDAHEDSASADCSFGQEYIDHILANHTCCRWECEGKSAEMKEPAPMVQLFLRHDSEHFHKSAKDALAAVPS